MADDDESMEALAGRNVRAMRTTRGWSQEHLASLMRDHGAHGWRQTTVTKTEAASRPLRVNEAYLLARCFDEPIEALLRDQSLSGQWEALLAALDRQRVAQARRDDAATALADAEDALSAAQDAAQQAQADSERESGSGKH